MAHAYSTPLVAAARRHPDPVISHGAIVRLRRRQVPAARACVLVVQGGKAGEGYLRTSIKEAEVQPDPGTDLALLLEGWATVTAIRTITADDGVELPLEEDTSRGLDGVVADLASEGKQQDVERRS